MSGIRLETLMAAHEALMRVWHTDPLAPLPHSLRSDCLKVAGKLRTEMVMLGLEIEVTPPATKPMREAA